ncbi:MAG TPA: 50S ribosomal protein L4 [Coxiellaceae bacterium]|nr:50S ribosomal protein L4 [Coxiellaceae bacterium]
MQVMGKTPSTLTVSEDIFSTDFNEPLIHQVLTVYMTNARQGTKAQKNRSAVSGGGAKPWKQKGSGRARAGTSRSPIWRKGGVTFAATPKEYSQKVNKKMYRKAMASIVAELQRQERLKVIDSLAMDAPKTKDLQKTLTELSLKNVLIIVDQFDESIFLSARNLPNIGVITASEVSPLDLVAHENVLMTASSLKILEERLSR